jgi:hypothetical protein
VLRTASADWFSGGVIAVLGFSLILLLTDWITGSSSAHLFPFRLPGLAGSPFLGPKNQVWGPVISRVIVDMFRVEP